MKSKVIAIITTLAIMIILSIPFVISYLNSSKDFSKIKSGMTYKMVKNEVGKEDKSLDVIFGIKFLVYNEGFVIVIQNDEVLNIMTKKEFENIGTEMNQYIKQLDKNIIEFDKKKVEWDKQMENIQQIIGN